MFIVLEMFLICNLEYVTQDCNIHLTIKKDGFYLFFIFKNKFVFLTCREICFRFHRNDTSNESHWDKYTYNWITSYFIVIYLKKNKQIELCIDFLMK